MKRYALGLVVLVCASACVTERSTDFSNAGTACLEGQTIEVDFQTCLSSSCDTLEGAACEATVSGDTITVTSSATVVSEGQTCTADCGAAVTSCEVTGDVGGATTIAYAGSESTDIACPSAR